MQAFHNVRDGIAARIGRDDCLRCSHAIQLFDDRLLERQRLRHALVTQLIICQLLLCEEPTPTSIASHEFSMAFSIISEEVKVKEPPFLLLDKPRDAPLLCSSSISLWARSSWS